MARKDLVQVVVRVDGVTLTKDGFRTFSGGEVTAADVKNVKAAGQVELARGGRISVGNVTVSREDDGEVNLLALTSRVGKANMEVDRIPLDDDLNPLTAKKRTYTGKLIRVAVGEGDAGSDSEMDDFELEMSCDGLVS
jgi:hypothetical protein